MYYKRYELQWRLNVFFSASIMAGAVSGVRLVSFFFFFFYLGLSKVLIGRSTVARVRHCQNGRDPRL